VESLGWPAINTAIPTCLVAAQTSLGATTGYQYCVCRRGSGWALRLLLCTGIPVATRYYRRLCAGNDPVWAIAAWISAGSDRIAYLGRQLGFSFALFILHDFGPVTDLYLPRDRVIGILLGIIVMGVLDYALWPRRSIVLARHHSAAALHTLAKFTTDYRI